VIFKYTNCHDASLLSSLRVIIDKKELNLFQRVLVFTTINYFHEIKRLFLSDHIMDSDKKVERDSGLDFTWAANQFVCFHSNIISLLKPKADCRAIVRRAVINN
jgi:hypothetical protein